MPEQEQLAVGDVLDGKYRVEGLIGRGGMGAVYRARHIGLDAPRAIKLMRPELAQDEAFIQRFENEAFLAEGVRHPNVVALYDFASLPDGTKYIVWELVEGETVRDGLERDTVFTSSEVIRLVSQIGGGLAAAHKKGILHRDVSPDNIMICAGSTTDRNAKLLDFGVAKAAGTPKSMATTTGMVFGKMGYASPEQMGLLRGDESLDARTDVFSMAAVAYAMLTGKPPFVTSSMRSFLHDLMIAPEAEVRARFVADLEEPWRDLLARALSRNREERPPSMEAFVEEIREIAHAPHRRADASALTRALPAKTVRSALLAAAAIFGTAVVVFTLVSPGDFDSVPLPPPVALHDRSVGLGTVAGGEAVAPRTAEPDNTAEPEDDPVAAENPVQQGPEPFEPKVGIGEETPLPPPEGASGEAFEPPTLVLDVSLTDESGTTEAPSSSEDEAETLEPGLDRVDTEEASVEAAPEPNREPGPPPKVAPREPQRIEYVQPVYPPRAIKAEVEGDVVLTIVIAPSGDVTEATIVHRVDGDLERAAIEAVRQWKYEPRDSPVEITVTIGFHLT